MTRVVAFTGMPGSGKSVAVEVARRHGFPVFRMGDAVWEEVRARGLPLGEEAVGKVASEMRSKHGPGVWAERTVAKARASKADLVVIDGVRSLAEVETFRSALGADFTLVALKASPEVRLSRLLARARPDDVRNEDEFRRRDARELGWGIADAIASADLTIANEGDLGELEREVEVLLTGK